ncbi:putative repeat protein (TIGR03943 family) [Rhodoglobus vestalii]|uniref:Putative repeat protein (TIGR03943 family) n=1 Tax=Rhodoglobus vestalii TaxID=193384 RepID=A0A8H2PZ69_9MICO|nr:TIGR03943 family protein [Rhodoglobus vestalii]TQO21039.1 putative repeat protein (TIGR03943 family) [Rhodoglobus vestalii]
MILIVIAVSATVWLAVTQQLVLYIHPRYIVFTVIMAAIALALGVMSVAVRPRSPEEPAVSKGWAKIVGITALVLSGVVAVSLIVVPPATLSSATASQRDIVGSTVGSDSQNADDVANADESLIASFTVVDWASLLRQTSDPSFYADKTATVVGFITESEDDPENIFYLSRFTVTCCAVDAQPTGIAVYAPNWKNSFAVDAWVEVTGLFEINPSSRSDASLVLVPNELSGVERPSEPYLY